MLLENLYTCKCVIAGQAADPLAGRLFVSNAPVHSKRSLSGGLEGAKVAGESSGVFTSFLTSESFSTSRGVSDANYPCCEVNIALQALVSET